MTTLLTTERAFPVCPRVDRYFPAESIEAARQRIIRCLERGDGPALVIGGAGMGKTLLLEAIEKATAARFRIAKVAGTQHVTARGLLQAILFALDGVHVDGDEGDLRIAIVARLEDSELWPRGAVLLVDEAQALPVPLLEELRLLSNLAREGRPLVQLVLAGSPTLEEPFASPELEAFNQRLAERCYLSPLNHGETHEYVRAHLAAAEVDEKLFASDALDALHTATDGVPRLINQIGDRAIVMATEAGDITIDARTIQAAWSDLHQLPAPWNCPEPTGATRSEEQPVASIIEFGELAPMMDEPPAETLNEGETPVLAPRYSADEALDALPSQTTCESQVVKQADIDQPPEPAPEDDATPDADKLFGGDFAEEEVVIERFAPLDAAFTSATQFVDNSADAGFSATLDRLAPEYIVGDALDDEAAASDVVVADDEISTEAATDVVPYSSSDPDNANDAHAEFGFQDERETYAFSGDVAETELDPDVDHNEADESSVLVIEPDTIIETISQPTVRRQDYRQLFAGLRKG